MKFSESWLREWIKLDNSTAMIANQLTMAGLEVDGVHAVADTFSHVVVGSVLQVEPHPNADRLRVCQVDVAQNDPLNIVCGAANVRPGLKVPVALVGAQLPGGVQINQTELRGVASQGMICAARELGIDEIAAGKGIMELPQDAPVGTPLVDYMQLDDHVIAIDLTPNRSDCLSIRGIARELAVINRIAMRELQVEPVSAQISDTLTIHLTAPEACPRYVARVVKGITADATSPLWMQEKLRRSGIRTINPVVDVCNYVMLELGQPMHGFDLAHIEGDIHVRLAKADENITLLDEQAVSLEADTLIIADDVKPLALAGIMGGCHSAVSSKTQDVLLEAAFFNPVNISVDARRYHISSDSSYRFSRGVDYDLPTKAMERATQLLQHIAGGQAGPVMERTHEEALPAPRQVNLRRDHITRLLGIHIIDDEVERILTALGMSHQSTGIGWLVKIPTHRFDIALEADLIEELARIHGYDSIPATPSHADLSMRPIPENRLSQTTLRQWLLARGYHEAISYSFIDPKLQQLLAPNVTPIEISNPISSDMSVMRHSIWPGLLQALQFNVNRQCQRVRLFESGLVFNSASDQSVQQQSMLGMLAYGPIYPEQWANDSRRETDFFDLKNDVEALLGLTMRQLDFTWVKAEHSSLHPGQSAALMRGDQCVGYLGALHPQIAQQLGLHHTPILFEVLLAALTEAKLPQFVNLSKYPAIRRDLALVVDQTLNVSQLTQLIRDTSGHLLANVQIFDVYQGQGLPADKKSVAVGLTFQDPSRTLRDEEINQIIHNVVGVLADKLDATLRT